jgi:hypothetical protein
MMERGKWAASGVVCPCCGNQSWNVPVQIFDENGGSASAVETATLNAAGEVLAVSKSDFSGGQMSASALGGVAEGFVSNLTSENEEGTEACCDTIRLELNRVGTDWAAPQESTQKYVDCECRSNSDPQHILKIQIVRARIDNEFWRELNETRTVTLQAAVSSLVNRLKDSIDLKVNKIPMEFRGDIVLGLNALPLPYVLLDDFVSETRATLGSYLASLGFPQIWLVGPSVGGTVAARRLDVIS